MNRVGSRRRTIHVLTEAQNALNVAFGAILSAYIGNSLAEIDNGPFNHHQLARFFLGLAMFILGLCVGNSLLLRGAWRPALLFVLPGVAGAIFANVEARSLGFEVTVLQILCGCWISALLGSNLILSLFLYIHHRTTT